MKSSRYARCLILTLAFTLGRSASAHDLPKQGTPEAEALINRGLDLREKGEDEAALHEFRHAHELDRGPRSLAQIALAEQALGRWVDAEAHLVEALRQSLHPWITTNGATLARALEEIRSRLGSLDLRDGVVGAEVRVNGQAAGVLPLPAPLRVVAGSVALEVRAPGYLSLQRTVMVPANGLARENLVLVKAAESVAAPGSAEPRKGESAPATAAASASDAPGRWSWQKRAGVGGFGAGALSLVVGVVFHIKHESSVSAFVEAGCGRIDPPCPDRMETINAQKTMMIVGYVGAAALAGAGAALFLAAPETAGKRDAPSGDGARPRVSALSCGPGMTGFGLLCAGRF